jgi:hypothetical protein
MSRPQFPESNFMIPSQKFINSQKFMNTYKKIRAVYAPGAFRKARAKNGVSDML